MTQLAKMYAGMKVRKAGFTGGKLSLFERLIRSKITRGASCYFIWLCNSWIVLMQPKNDPRIHEIARSSLLASLAQLKLELDPLSSVAPGS